MYQTGCGVGQKASNEQQGTATEQTTTYQPLFTKNRFATRAATYMPIRLHPCSPHQFPDHLVYPTGCNLVRRFRMNKKGRQYNRQKHSPPYKKMRCDASRRNSQHHLHLDCCCCLPPPPPLFFFFIILRCLHCRQPPSLCIGWDRQIDIETT